MMCLSPRHLVLLSCVTSGKQNEDLGSDESQIVMIAYLLYDVLNNKVRYHWSFWSIDLFIRDDVTIDS